MPQGLEAGGFADNALPVLIGVVVGWGLGEGTRMLREHRDTKRLRKALSSECETILNQLPQLKDIIDQAIQALGAHNVLPTEHVHTPRTAYASSVTRLSPRLSPAERNLLHVAYEHLRVADDFLDRYHRDLLVDLREGVVNDPWGAYEAQLRDVASSLDTIDRLLRSYLSKDPIDPFPPS